MEMKSYQRQAISDLSRYMELLNEEQDYIAAFFRFWHEKAHLPWGTTRTFFQEHPISVSRYPPAAGRPFSPATQSARFSTRCL